MIVDEEEYRRYFIIFLILLLPILIIFFTLSTKYPYLFIYYPPLPTLNEKDVTSITYLPDPLTNWKVVITNCSDGIYVTITSPFSKKSFKRKMGIKEFKEMVSEINHVLFYAEPDRFRTSSPSSNTPTLIIKTKTYGKISMKIGNELYINGRPYKLENPLAKVELVDLHLTFIYFAFFSQNETKKNS